MKYDIIVNATIDYLTTIEAENEEEAKSEAMDELVYSLPSNCKFIKLDAD